MVNKPEHDPSGPSANDDDDAVWRDLVARLEGPSAAGYSPDGLTDGFSDGFSDGPSPAGDTAAGDTPAGDTAVGDAATGTAEQRHYRSFSDFDPLGVSRPAHRPGGRDSRPRMDAASDGAPDGPRDYPADGPWPEDEGFVPEDPPPLSNVEPALMLAWTGALGGPLAVLLAALFWRDAPVTAIIAMIAVFVISAGYLMFRLPSSRDDDGDDGAVV